MRLFYLCVDLLYFIKFVFFNFPSFLKIIKQKEISKYSILYKEYLNFKPEKCLMIQKMSKKKHLTKDNKQECTRTN